MKNATFTLSAMTAAVACAVLAACGGGGGSAGTGAAAPVTSISASQIQNNTSNAYYKAGVTAMASTEQALAATTTNPGAAKNIILFVGDGMGISTITAARILEGQRKGQTGEENVLSFEGMPFGALSKVYSANQQTPDSAPTATAMVTGVKTDDGVLGVDEDVQRASCATTFGNELVTALELAEIAGKSTGIISTARITHATPAANYAKSVERNWEDDGDMPAAAIAAGCKDIADQLVNFEPNLKTRFPKATKVNGLEVVMGGGRRSFLPNDAAANSPDAVSAIEGDRKDGRNLVTEWKTRYPNGTYVFDKTGFNAINAASVERVFGLFNEDHMQYSADIANDVAGEPSLSEMTGKAIDILAKNAQGYFMMVEAGRIDHAHHAGNAAGALSDTIELSNAVRVALDKTNAADTLIIVTADHGHTFTIAGYPKRGNPILGKVVEPGKTSPALASDGLPYTTLGYMNGLGFRDLGTQTNSDAIYAFSPDAGRKDLTNINTENPGYHQEALIPLSSETHSGEDVSIHARGPGAQLFAGTVEQQMIFHVMNRMGNLEALANASLAP